MKANSPSSISRRLPLAILTGVCLTVAVPSPASATPPKECRAQADALRETLRMCLLADVPEAAKEEAERGEHGPSTARLEHCIDAVREVREFQSSCPPRFHNGDAGRVLLSRAPVYEHAAAEADDIRQRVLAEQLEAAACTTSATALSERAQVCEAVFCAEVIAEADHWSTRCTATHPAWESVTAARGKARERRQEQALKEAAQAGSGLARLALPPLCNDGSGWCGTHLHWSTESLRAGLLASSDVESRSVQVRRDDLTYPNPKAFERYGGPYVIWGPGDAPDWIPLPPELVAIASRSRAVDALAEVDALMPVSLTWGATAPSPFALRRPSEPITTPGHEVRFTSAWVISTADSPIGACQFGEVATSPDSTTARRLRDAMGSAVFYGGDYTGFGFLVASVGSDTVAEWIIVDGPEDKASLVKCVTRTDSDWVRGWAEPALVAWCRDHSEQRRQPAREALDQAQANLDVDGVRVSAATLDLLDACASDSPWPVPDQRAHLVREVRRAAEKHDAERAQQAEARKQEEQRRREELLTGTDVELLDYCDVTLAGMRTAIRRVQEIERDVSAQADADDFRDRVAEAQLEAQDIMQRARLDLSPQSSLLLDVVAELGRRAAQLPAREARSLLEARDERCRL